MAERSVPYDLAAEEAVIGACVLSPVAREINLALLRPADFFKPLHGHVFAAIGRLHEAGEEIDALTVGALTDQFDPDVRVRLNEMANATPTVSSPALANIVLAHAKSRALITLSSDLARAGYEGQAAGEVAVQFAAALTDNELLRRHESITPAGYYPGVGQLDSGVLRDEAQPWIAQGVLRRGQRMLVVARAGIGKSTVLRQLAMCAENGVHPWTGQPTEHKRRAMIVELEAGEWDIVESTRTLLFAVQRALGTSTVAELAQPALLHRQGGIDLREPEGVAALEGAIRLAEPELVVMGPIKYLAIAKTGENYEIAALRLMNVINKLIARYQFALVLEAHFSRGDHGAPGGSERWVDWPDTGFGIHPPDDDVERRFETGGDGVTMTVKPFRIPRDSRVWLPEAMIRGRSHHLPWSVKDSRDHGGRSVYATRYGGTAEELYVRWDQGSF